ncbi:MAG: mandelate racemase/muconate lactonizing enzyme family protein [Burkholderiales bacterium]|jgi:L-alanine-DL-glutamate epimerase-like enolase superfamily enzyme|nr:mandelate racemase/muconate lactonizing enzyme family protein [Burkholderiales bacterium]
MKITAVESIRVEIPFGVGVPMPAFLGMGQRTVGTLLIRVDTDTGLTGWGDAFGHSIIPSTQAAFDTLVAPTLIGRDATQGAALVDALARQLNIYGRAGSLMFALAGLDLALHDLAGKAAGLPLHRLLGGARRLRLPAYASLTRYGDPDSVGRMCERAVAQGYRWIKLHEVTVDAVRAARAAIGPEVALMIDTNCPWSQFEAVEMARAFAPFAPAWLEEPCWPPENHAALAHVRRVGGLPIAAGENAITAQAFHDLFTAGAIDIAQPSPAKIGITESLRVFALADACNVALAPHTPYFGPGFLAGLHLHAIRAHTFPVEWLWYDLDATLYGDAIVPRDGHVDVPTGPGLGRDPDPAVIARYRA